VDKPGCWKFAASYVYRGERIDIRRHGAPSRLDDEAIAATEPKGGRKDSHQATLRCDPDAQNILVPSRQPATKAARTLDPGEYAGRFSTSFGPILSRIAQRPPLDRVHSCFARQSLNHFRNRDIARTPQFAHVEIVVAQTLDRSNADIDDADAAIVQARTDVAFR
jgi:hypothetical protein